MFLIALLILVGVLIYFTLYKPLQYWKELGVPYSKGWPFVGSARGLLFRKKSFFEIVLELYNEFPNLRYNGAYLFNRSALVIRDLDLIKELTIKEFDHFTDHVPFVDEEIDPVMGKTLFSLKGNKWRSMRATLSPAFTSSKMKSMFILMSECAEDFAKHFLQKKDEVIDAEMKETFSRYTNDVIASTAFGVKCDSLKDPENIFFVMGRKATSFEGFQGLKIFTARLMPNLFKLLRLHVFSASVEKFFASIVLDNIKQREEKDIIRPDLIHLLMGAKRGKLKHEKDTDTGAGFATVEESNIGRTDSLQVTKLTDFDLTSQAMIFFFAGFDTTSTMCCLLGHELAVNPDVQEKLQEEIDKTLQKCNDKITYEDLLHMTYLDQVVSEILRKWTPGFMIDRLCIKDYLIQPKNPGEKPLLIKKGNSLMIPIIGIHRDPEYYPNPDKFDPERFSEENKSKLVPGSYLPFGAGPRNCIGSRFALLEVKILFFHILSKFDFVVTKKTPIPLKLSPKQFNPMPDGGFWVGLKARKNTL